MALDVNDVVRITGTFKVDGVPTDPTTVVLVLRDPNGVNSTYTHGTDAELTKLSTGVYKFEGQVGAAGTWHYRWEGTGAVVAREQGSFYVNSPLF